MKKKIISLLVLLVAVSSAWAQTTLGIRVKVTWDETTINEIGIGDMEPGDSYLDEVFGVRVKIPRGGRITGGNINMIDFVASDADLIAGVEITCGSMGDESTFSDWTKTDTGMKWEGNPSQVVSLGSLADDNIASNITKIEFTLVTGYALTVDKNLHGKVTFKVRGDEVTAADEDDMIMMEIAPDDGWIVDVENVTTALPYGKWGVRRVQAAPNIAMQSTLDLTYVSTDDKGVATFTFQMPASNVKVNAEYLKISTLYFDPAEKTNLMTITTKVGDAAATTATPDEEGKLTKVLEGTEINLTANTGYKFRKVEVKKGDAAKTITIGDMELTYADGDNWETIVSKNSDKIKILSNRIVQVAQPAPNTYKYIHVWYTGVKPSDFIDPSKNYQWDTMEVYF